MAPTSPTAFMNPRRSTRPSVKPSRPSGFAAPRWLAGVGLVAALIAGVAIGWRCLQSDDSHPPQFCEIWQVYSFTPNVSATTYNSASGDATIIWVSGMDNGEKPGDDHSS